MVFLTSYIQATWASGTEAESQKADYLSLPLLLPAHAILSRAQPGKFVFYDTVESLETAVMNSGINMKSVYIFIAYLFLLIILDDHKNPKLIWHQYFRLTCLVLRVFC